MRRDTDPESVAGMPRLRRKIVPGIRIFDVQAIRGAEDIARDGERGVDASFSRFSYNVADMMVYNLNRLRFAGETGA
jgi:hypothetical protein